jgi:hypothetical protein
MELISRREWRTGYTPRELAQEWGIGVQRVYIYITEANRRLQSEFAARSADAVFRTLRTVAKKGKAGMMPGDLSAAVQAAKVLADISGFAENAKSFGPQQEKTEDGKPTINIHYHNTKAE